MARRGSFVSGAAQLESVASTGTLKAGSYAILTRAK